MYLFIQLSLSYFVIYLRIQRLSVCNLKMY